MLVHCGNFRKNFHRSLYVGRWADGRFIKTAIFRSFDGWPEDGWKRFDRMMFDRMIPEGWIF